MCQTALPGCGQYIVWISFDLKEAMSNCPCAKPLPNYPDAADWAPILWRILHAFAERGGKTVSPLFADEERRYWTLLIAGLPAILPCPLCREHAAEWLRTHPFAEPLKTVPATELYNFLTDYFYAFHEAVNARLGKPSFDRSAVAATFSGVRILEQVALLNGPISLAIRLSGLKLLDWTKWAGHARMLASVYGAA